MILIFTVLPFYSSILWPLLHCRWKDKDVTLSVTCRRRKTRASHHPSPAGGERQGRHPVRHLQEERDKDVTPSVTCRRRKTRTSHRPSPAGEERQGRHTVRHLQEEGGERQSAQQSFLKGQEVFKTIVNQIRNVCKMGWSRHGLFQVHRYHLELNINMDFSQSASHSFSISVSQYFS